MRTILPILVAVSLLLRGQASALDWAGKVQKDIRDLKHSDVQVRLRALDRLGQYRDREVIPLILKALEDPDPKVQHAAASLAGERGLRQAVPALLRWLSHWDATNRLSAAENLGRIGDNRAVKNLVRALVDPDLKVRMEVIRALGRLNTPNRDAVIPLLGRLGDTNAKVRKAAVQVLAGKRDHRAVIPLMGRLEDSAREVRIAAVVALGELGDAKAGPSLVRLLRDPRPDVASAAIRTLGKLRFEGATEPLVDLFKSGASRHRDEAASALANLGTDLAIRALVAGLTSPSLRPAARSALVDAGPRAQDLIVELLQDPRTERAVGVAAVEIARDARLRQAVPVIVEQIRVGKLPLLLLIQTLGKISDARAQRPLLDLLAHPNLEARAAALIGLDRIIDERAAAPLVRLLDDQNRNLRIRVIGYLGRLASRLATPRLLALARGTDRAVARAAVAALARARDPRASPTLVDLLGHRDRTIRRQASQALARIASRGSVDPLLELCRDSLAAIRVVCLQAIGGVMRGKTDDKVFALVKEMSSGTDHSVFLAATDAMAAMRDPRIPTLLIQRYHSLEPPLQRKVVEIIGNDPSYAGTSFPFLLQRLGEAQPELRSAAAWSIGKLGLRGTIAPRLMNATRDPSWMVRVNAVAALARLRQVKNQSLFRVLASDPVAYVRANAVLALGLSAPPTRPTGPHVSTPAARRPTGQHLFAPPARPTGPRSTRDPGNTRLLMERLLGDRSPWVRINALRALRQLSAPPTRKQLRAPDGRRWNDVTALTRSVLKEDVDQRVRQVAKRLLEPNEPDEGGWIGLYLLDPARRPLRSSPVLLVTPSGLVRAAVSDGRGELWEENTTDGYCYSELPPPMLKPSEN